MPFSFRYNFCIISKVNNCDLEPSKVPKVCFGSPKAKNRRSCLDFFSLKNSVVCGLMWLVWLRDI